MTYNQIDDDITVDSSSKRVCDIDPIPLPMDRRCSRCPSDNTSSILQKDYDIHVHCRPTEMIEKFIPIHDDIHCFSNLDLEDMREIPPPDELILFAKEFLKGPAGPYCSVNHQEAFHSSNDISTHTFDNTTKFDNNLSYDPCETAISNPCSNNTRSICSSHIKENESVKVYPPSNMYCDYPKQQGHKTCSSSLQACANVTVIPTSRDILLGRGIHLKKHPGNKHFQRIINDLKPIYLQQKNSREGKSEVISILMKTVKSYEGRFLEIEAKFPLIYRVSKSERIYKKCAQMLRAGSD